MKNNSSIDMASINTIRALSIDAIQKANSGHPGLPMGAAPATYMMWRHNMKINPSVPNWIDRDRFVLSAGHGSMLLYALLHLSGYDLSIDDLKNFRQLGSKTPGHPEIDVTPGVETSTGPLGQGAANGVGMAIVEKMLANRFNKDEFNIIDHYTFVLVGDGCLMEGISSEAASLAGHLKLGKLITLYDSNDISLDGPTHLSFTENVKQRYESYGWQVIVVENGDNDLEALNNAIIEAKKEKLKPTLIEVKTTIGFGSPNKAGKSASHGAPLGEDEIKLVKKNYNLDPEKKFFVSEEVKENFSEFNKENQLEYKKWEKMMKVYSLKYPQKAQELYDSFSSSLPNDWDSDLPVFETGKSVATRVSSSRILNAIANKVKWLSGGSADLSCSTKVIINNEDVFDGISGKGRNIFFGVREHAMGAIANGISFHGGSRPFVSTFFSFVDYVRPAIRMSALAKVPAIYIFTHDSIAVGEDGPTHQPVEQIASVRAMPGVTVLRPGDANETVESWRYIMNNTTEPIILILSRQNLKTIDRNKYGKAEAVNKGAYVLADTPNPELAIIATGSEINLALDVHENLKTLNINSRVISMPSWEIFEKQSDEYKQSILPASISKRVSIEAGSTFGWQKYTGLNGLNIGIDEFGTSAPGNQVFEKFGFTVDQIVPKIEKYMNK